MNESRIKGTLRQAKGEVQRQVGKLTGNEGKVVKGNVNKAAGKVQQSYGRLKDDLKD